jgi:hypothetical protein
MEKENRKPLIVRLSKEQANENTKDLRVYVVDAGGKVIEKASFNKGEAQLKSSQQQLEGKSKIYIAPEVKTNTQSSVLTERKLLKANAYETVKNFVGNYLDIYQIPSGIFGPINYYNCRITGHVKKNFLIDGKWENLPLCDMRVHICEVETELVWPYIPIYYRPIPDWVIHEIGLKFKDITKIQFVKPPIPDPIGPVSRFKTNLPLRSLSASVTKQTFTSRVNSITALPDQVKTAMASGSVDLIRKTMIDYHDIIYPYLCLWPVLWPWIYTYDEETIVTTDCNGHFEMWENTFTEDGPLNIYIWVEAFINGHWVTVYKPSLVCNTWWNYACGTDININITDSRVGPCSCGSEGPADAFWFRSIGNAAGALHIEQGLAHNVNVQGVAVNNTGCTNALGISDYLSPFGGILALEVFAGENIYGSGSGVTHFRWKATKIKDENLNPIPSGFQTTIILNANNKIYREYIVKLDTVHHHSFNLEIAPSGAGDNIAFRIPHQDITQEASIMAAFPTNLKYWRDVFWTGATVDSNSLGNGLFRFELELGKYSGSNFIVTDVNRTTFQISEFGDLDSSQDATGAYLNLISAGIAHNLKMYVRIDNAHCNADIHDVMLNETGALSGPCGFIKYDNTDQHAHISFEASHPRNFATFSFSIVKGNNTVATGINPSGYVISSVGGYTLSGGLFSNDYTVLSLLNGCPGQAAFSENLYVAALATDGSRRLDEYDRPDTNAFALSNT